MKFFREAASTDSLQRLARVSVVALIAIRCGGVNDVSALAQEKPPVTASEAVESSTEQESSTRETDAASGAKPDQSLKTEAMPAKKEPNVVPAESTSLEQPLMEAKPSEETLKASVPTYITLEGAILKTIDTTLIAAQVPGIIQQSNVKEGTVVKKGQLLAKVKDDATKLKLEQLKTQVLIAKRKQENTIDKKVAEKSREVAKNEYERALNSNARVPNTYPLNEIDRLRLIAERSQLEVDRAVHAIQMAELDVQVAASEFKQTEELLDRHSILSPVDGTIVSVEKRLGEWVEPGTDIFRIVRTDTLRIEGLIPAVADHGNLVGRKTKVTLKRAGKALTFEGTVVFVSPDVNPVNSLVRVFVEVANTDGVLRPGLAVQAAIEVEVEAKAETEEDAAL